MHIRYSPHLTIGQVRCAALCHKFRDLIARGELRPRDSDEFVLDENGELFVLAPDTVLDESIGETDVRGHILVSAAEWDF